MPQVSPVSGGAVSIFSRRWKKGDIGPDGRLFWRYNPPAKNGMHWVTKAKYDLMELGWRRRHAARQADPIKKAARNAYCKAFQTKRRQDPAYRDKNRLYCAEYKREVVDRDPIKKAEFSKRALAKRKLRLKTDAAFRTMLNLRRRLRVSVKKALLGHKPPRTPDEEAVRFLMWLAKDLGLPDSALGPRYQIDHLIPVCKWDGAGISSYSINSPENVQWLTVSENASKADKMPSGEDILRHLTIVKKWRASLN